MKLKFTAPILITIALLASSTTGFSMTDNSSSGAEADAVNQTSVEAPSEVSTNKTIMFTCESSGEIPVTMARFPTLEQYDAQSFLKWERKYFSSSVAQELCQQVATKLSSYYTEVADLDESSLTVGEVEGISVACIAPVGENSCAEDGVLFSLQGMSNPQQVLRDMSPEHLKQPSTRGDFRLPLGLLLPF